MEKHQCPVCGYPELKVKPYSFGLGSTEFCQCCGFQFGVTDDDYNVSHEEWRKVWVARGSPWFSIAQTAPDGWDSNTQLRSVVVGDD